MKNGLSASVIGCLLTIICPFRVSGSAGTFRASVTIYGGVRARMLAPPLKPLRE